MNTNESGHIINVTNFQTIISICSSFGSGYAPQRAELTIPGLNITEAAALLSVKDVNILFAAWKTAIIHREATFNPLAILVSRIVAAAKALNIRGSELDNVLTAARKITGQRANPKQVPVVVDPNTTPANPGTAPAIVTPKNISASQMSFDSRVGNMHLLIQLLSAIPAYIPIEADLSIGALKTLYATMASQNKAVVDSHIALTTARSQRDIVLYRPSTGLYDIAAAVKNYVKSAYTAKSHQFKELSAIRFTNPTRK
jgi:hypothetical protein